MLNNNNNNNKETTMHNLKVGDIITLQWNGYKGVPMYRNYDKATILEFKRKRIVVETNGEILKILPNQIQEKAQCLN